MTRPSLVLVRALLDTAARLRTTAAYQWGHLGQCNCGHLVQTVCRLPPAKIHAWALEREGDWEQLANAYCPTSGYAVDDVITELCALGFSTADLAHLEKLDDPAVLAMLPSGSRWLARNVREDVVAYLETWAALLADRLPAAFVQAA